MTEIESFDADDWLGEKRDIYHHPYISDRTNSNGYAVADLMADFANECLTKCFSKISSEDVRRWNQLFVGYGEEIMKKDIKATLDKITHDSQP
jgi:hypothetical protein